MNEENGTARHESGVKQASVRAEPPPDWSQTEADEIKGWALRWDATALSRASLLAERMRELREASGNP